MNNKPFHLLNWLANVGLCEHLNSNAPGSLEILKRSLHDVVGIINTISKITETEQTEGVKDLIAELNAAGLLVDPLIAQNAAKRSPGEYYFNTFAHGENTSVRTLEETWAARPTVAPTTRTPSLQEMVEVAGGRAFDPLHPPVSTLPHEVGYTHGVVKTEMETPPAEIHLDEPKAEAAEEVPETAEVETSEVRMRAVSGCALSFNQRLPRDKFMEGVSAKAQNHTYPMVGIEPRGNAYIAIYRDRSLPNGFRQSKRLGKLALMAAVQNYAFTPTNAVLANMGRRIQEAVAKHQSVTVTIHDLSESDILVFISIDYKDFAFITTKEKLAAYLPDVETI